MNQVKFRNRNIQFMELIDQVNLEHSDLQKMFFY